MSELSSLLALHMAEELPAAIAKGDAYGEVCSVMIGADIYGWACRLNGGERFSPVDVHRRSVARDELSRSIAAFPAVARPYYERLVDIADLALDVA